MPVKHVLKVNGYGGRQAKGNEKRQCFKGWETLVIYLLIRIIKHSLLIKLTKEGEKELSYYVI